jgi:hypothetical protein
MSDLNVCCTNIEQNLSEKIYEKVEMMKGKVSEFFTDQVTHLVTNKVGSAEYHVSNFQ